MASVQSSVFIVRFRSGSLCSPATAELLGSPPLPESDPGSSLSDSTVMSPPIAISATTIEPTITGMFRLLPPLLPEPPPPTGRGLMSYGVGVPY